ncbi:MAG TPA: hypothetical protein VFN10_05565, partial [Thermoanaerobaculia bacterium]|nr:hypothetical protein [Thermoanaerobaculia bacterium]
PAGFIRDSAGEGARRSNTSLSEYQSLEADQPFASADFFVLALADFDELCADELRYFSRSIT